MTSPTDLEKLARLATPGPRSAEGFWREGDDSSRPAHRWRIFLLGHENPRTNSRDCDWTEADAKFIAACDRETVLELLADRRELVAGLKLAVEIANRFYGSMFCYDTDTADIAKLQALAAGMGET